jgi:hypothetical protein
MTDAIKRLRPSLPGNPRADTCQGNGKASDQTELSCLSPKSIDRPSELITGNDKP